MTESGRVWPRPRGHRGTEASGRRPPHAEKRERVATVPCTHGGERAAWPGSARVLTWENAPALLVSGAFHRTELRSCSHCWEGDPPPVTGPPDSGVFRQLGDSFNAELFFFLFFFLEKIHRSQSLLRIVMLNTHNKTLSFKIILKK